MGKEQCLKRVPGLEDQITCMNRLYAADILAEVKKLLTRAIVYGIQYANYDSEAVSPHNSSLSTIR